MTVHFRSFSPKSPFGVEFESSANLPRNKIIDTISSTSKVTEVRSSDWEQTYENNFWHLKTDSTCGPAATDKHKDYGFEVASYIAKGVQSVLDIATTASALEKAGLEVNKNCGFHIHVDVRNIDRDKIASMLAWFAKIEPYIQYMVPSHRLENKYCKLWTHTKRFDLVKSYSADEFWKLIRPRDVSVNNNHEKRVSFNLVNYETALINQNNVRKTVEFRLPESSFNFRNVYSWIVFFVLFVENNENKPMPENQLPLENLKEFFRCLGLEAPDGHFFILSKGLFLLRKWILERMQINLKESEHKSKFSKILLEQVEWYLNYICIKDAENISEYSLAVA